MSQGDQQDPQPVPSVTDAGQPTQDVVREEARRHLQQIGVGFQFSTAPSPNALIEKLQPEHIAQALKGADNDSWRDHCQRMTFGILGIVSFLVICWMFLSFQQQALLEKVLALLIGFAGGFGIGRWKSKT